MMAREALRSVLRKSGSDSPTDSPEPGFSFYDNNTEDPLSHVTITEQRPDSQEQSVESQKVKAESKSKLKKSVSLVGKSMMPDSKDGINKTSRPEEIFSDSETLVEGNRGVTLRTSKSSASIKSHKRSRSDMSWLKSVPKPSRPSRIYSEDIGAAEDDSGIILGILL